MSRIKQRTFQIIGVIGTLFWILYFIVRPSFPTPDELVILIAFIFMSFSQAIQAIKRFGLFLVLLLVYESFRSIADKLNTHVHYLTAPHFDQTLFGNLPTVYLQNWLWRGRVSWYDYVLFFPYFLHFVMPLGLGILIWKTRDRYFWPVMNTYLIVAFASFITFFLFPSAPPWLASQNHYIQPIHRISTDVWYSMGLNTFPLFYAHVEPNLVAAIPSLHAAWATLLALFVYKIYGRRWGSLATIYPLLIFVGTIYVGEHYFFDILAGVLYAVVGYKTVPIFTRFVSKHFNKKIISKRLKLSNA